MPRLRPLSTALTIATLAMVGPVLVAQDFACATSNTATVAAAPAARSVNRMLKEEIRPQLDTLFNLLVAEKGQVAFDGQAPFKAGDKFLPGKIAAGMGDVVLGIPGNDPRLGRYLKDFSEIADLTVDMDNHTWGIYYYVSTLVKLKDAGLLDRAVQPDTLAKLREKLDWRSFVTVPDLKLIDLPTNYYGVAFSIARLRMLLGWEDDSASRALMAKMLQHYAEYSGTYDFSDETAGDGRFDRYSILLAAEICERFVETGLVPTPELKAKLRKAADVALRIIKSDGEGFSFGRSIGPYGDTAALEILSIAAYLDVLTPEEKRYAYAYACQVFARYASFWYDQDMHSVNMWEKGRSTDGYRGKNRMLGENLSLLHQLVASAELWNRMGLADTTPRADLQAWLDRTQPRFSLTWFAKGEYDRALAIYRDRGHVFSLLMVNGGPGQHANSPYYPLPFSIGLISGVPDSGPAHAQLLPKFKLADGSELLPTAYLQAIKARPEGAGYRVDYRQDALDRVGRNAPVKDGRIRLSTTYRLEPGAITRTDTYTPTGPLKVERLSLEFASFSDAAVAEGRHIRFGHGDVTDFSVTGLARCEVEPAPDDAPFRSPFGPMKSHVTCASDDFTLQKPLTISWTIRYQ